MVIQRVQTLYLLLGVVAMSVFLFVPFGYTTFADAGNIMLSAWRPLDMAGLLVPSCASIFLMLVAVFLFKSQGVQRMVVVFSSLLALASIGVVVYFMTAGFADANAAVSVTGSKWSWGVALPVCAVLLQVAAIRGITRDMNLLASYDRLR
ncbi:MAG: DUF4293 domain-containing protein [Paramuribaculum sp.]|nr:DUF4293 domain-containing protein [Paramuribaculum sp.]